VRAGFGCLVLFLLPFAGTGIFAGIQAIRSAMVADWEQAGLLAAFARRSAAWASAVSPPRT
jgi:hypothetical protein